jgi:cytoskeletal protein CcmA (bactofilin family)
MFGFGKPKVITSVNHFDSLIAPSMTIAGPVGFDGTLKIAGRVEGNITGADGGKSKTTVMVEKGGCVTGDIVADTVIIHGEVCGNISANSVCLASTAKLPSNAQIITYNVLQIDPGAMIRDTKIKAKSGFDLLEKAEQAEKKE